MKTIPVSEVSNIKMARSNEKKYSVIIHNGVVKEWVAIGWIELRKATDEDKEKYSVTV